MNKNKKQGKSQYVPTLVHLDESSRVWMRNNLGTYGMSAFVREAVRTEIESRSIPWSDIRKPLKAKG